MAADGEGERVWSSLVRRLLGGTTDHTRRRRMITATLSAVAVLGTLVTLVEITSRRRTGDTIPPAIPSTTSTSTSTSATSVDVTSTTEAMTTTSEQASAAEVTSTAPAPEPTPEPTTEASTSPSTSSSTLPSPTVDFGTATILDLDVTTGLIVSSDGSQAMFWSLADGRGLALQPTSHATRSIASIPLEVLGELCGGDQMVWTGTNVFLAATSSYAAYSPANDSWAVASLPSQRYCARKRLTVWTGSRIALVGGATAPFEDPSSTAITTISLFDPGTNAWSESSPAPAVRSGDLSATFVHGVIAYAGDGPSLSETAPILLYHLDSDSWTALDPPGPLTYTPYVTTFRDRLVVIGLDNSSGAWTDDNLTTWEMLQPSAPFDGGRHPVGFVGNDNRLVYLYGAHTTSIFDGTKWFESAQLDLPTSWNTHGVTTASGYLVIGGSSTSSASTSAAKVFTVPIDGIPPALFYD